VDTQPQNRAATVWVAVADSARARLFAARNALAPLDEIETLVNPEARIPQRELVSDAPGRSFRRVGRQRALMSSEVNAKQHETLAFARQIAERLNEARVRGEYHKLVLVAAPAFLGVLREQLDKHVLELVCTTLDKDLTQLRAEELRARLPQRLGV
jgi:protein required for attachment to host cells